MAPQRKRALTIPLSNPSWMLWRRQKTTNQSESILFRKLPLEARELIYQYTSYFSDKVESSISGKGLDVHVFSHARKLVWRRCSGIDGIGCSPHCYRKFYAHTPRSANLLAVVLTCRRIEAINILYSHNTFAFRNLSTITSFTSIVLPQRLSCIRSLRLEWVFCDYEFDYPYGTSAAYSEMVEKPFDQRWDALWEVLTTRMRGLRKLHVRLHGDFQYHGGGGGGEGRHGYGRSVWGDEQIFGLMRQIHSLQSFEVEANWMPMASSIAGGHFQFSLLNGTDVVSHWED
ncbi:hypothetical protein BJX65DRAFT_309897 [Aspergillus insuetus]